ncbi:MAG TPA: class II aldolase/adducin family protein, partial [Roseiflexaceae bacterium]
MSDESWTALMEPMIGSEERLSFTIAGETSSGLMTWYVTHLRDTLSHHGHMYRSSDGSSPPTITDRASSAESPPVRLVLNLCDLDRPRPVHRRGQGTFVATIVQGPDDERAVLKAAYPVLVRSLSNMVVFNTRVDGVLESHFITIEQGHYVVRHAGDDQAFFERIYERIQPLACSHLVINNEFVSDLPDSLWAGDETTRAIGWAGRQLDAMGLLPAAFPIDHILSARDLRHVKLLYGIGGLSYGNLSARAPHDPRA